MFLREEYCCAAAVKLSRTAVCTPGCWLFFLAFCCHAASSRGGEKTKGAVCFLFCFCTGLDMPTEGSATPSRTASALSGTNYQIYQFGSKYKPHFYNIIQYKRFLYSDAGWDILEIRVDFFAFRSKIGNCVGDRGLTNPSFTDRPMHLN